MFSEAGPLNSVPADATSHRSQIEELGVTIRPNNNNESKQALCEKCGDDETQRFVLGVSRQSRDTAGDKEMRRVINKARDQGEKKQDDESARNASEGDDRDDQTDKGEGNDKTDQSEVDGDDGQPAIGVRAVKPPTPLERETHELTHMPYQPWCGVCVRSRGLSDQHRSKKDRAADEVEEERGNASGRGRLRMPIRTPGQPAPHKQRHLYWSTMRNTMRQKGRRMRVGSAAGQAVR